MLRRLLTGLVLAGGLALGGGIVHAAPVAPAVASEPVPKLGTEWSSGMRFVPNFDRIEPPRPAPAVPVRIERPDLLVPTTTPAPPPIATQTALVTAAPVVERRRPVSVAIEALRVVAPVTATGVDVETGQLSLPADADTVVWYEHGAAPGEDGSAVLAGHVDFDGRRGVFFDLDGVAVGSVVTVTHDDGTTLPFQVVDIRSHAKPDLPTDELFRREGDPALVLITCGGEFDHDARSYRSNVVVTAVPLR